MPIRSHVTSKHVLQNSKPPRVYLNTSINPNYISVQPIGQYTCFDLLCMMVLEQFGNKLLSLFHRGNGSVSQHKVVSQQHSSCSVELLNESSSEMGPMLSIKYLQCIH